MQRCYMHLVWMDVVSAASLTSDDELRKNPRLRICSLLKHVEQFYFCTVHFSSAFFLYVTLTDASLAHRIMCSKSCMKLDMRTKKFNAHESKLPE